VSVRSNGVEGNQPSFEPDVSADGRYVVFHSEASTLVPGDTNAARDVFLHDRRTGTTRRVSVHSNGGQANSQSTRPAISADGRTVVFESRASNLVAGDSNDEDDVFVHDLVTGRTRLVSVRSNGAQGDTISELPDISGGGRFVVFRSPATNLVGGDSNDAADIFLHDRRTGRTRRISVDSNGAQSDADSEVSAISANGRFIAFDSVATNLVGNDSNGQRDVFVHDRRTGKTRRVSLRSNGAEVSDFSRSPSITANGRFVAFESNATDYVPNDTNGQQDVFLHDRRTATTRRVSVRAGGGQGNHASYEAGLSGDGRWVAFTSQASNLVSSDTNGAPDIFVRGPLR